MLTETSDLLECWPQRFECLSHSQCPSDEMIQHFKERVPCLSTEFLERADFVGDSTGASTFMCITVRLVLKR